MAWEIRYYLESRGRPPVEEFISNLPEESQALVRARIAFLGEVGNRAKEPHSKHLGEGLLELRVKSHRILYCFTPGRVIVLLHGFTKKTWRIPKTEMDIALKRKEEVENEN